MAQHTTIATTPGATSTNPGRTLDPARTAGGTPRSSARRRGMLLLLVLAAILTSACQSLRPPVAVGADGAAWTARLPACPCEQPAIDELDDGWAVDRADIETYHSGAAVCFRSYPSVQTDEGRSGQQCCYDDASALITSGPGAGTPDRASTCAGEREDGTMKVRVAGIAGHLLKDVRHWTRMSSWQEYNRHWPPDTGNSCGSVRVGR